MDLKINLATRFFIDQRKLSLATVGVVCVLLVLAAYNFAVLGGNAGRAKRLRADLALLQARFDASAKGVSATEYQRLLKHITAVNGILAARGYDWLVLLDRLETVIPDGVTLTSIDPNRADGTLKLSGLARNFSALRNLMENLEAAPYASSVFLQNQGQISVGTTQQGLSFTVTCKVDLS